MEILGIDIGGSGIKGAPVDTETGEMLASRYRIPTPDPAKPKKVAKAVKKVVKHFEWEGPVGCGFPAALRDGVAMTAANVHDKWIGKNVAKRFTKKTGCPVYVINDADAAGLAEMRFGAGKGQDGVVFLVTIGTGLGTALFSDGVLVPNTELGHIEIRGKDAERRASDSARKRKDWSWKKWAKKLDEYLHTIEYLLWPDLIILGGGASKPKKREKFMPYLTVKADIVPAEMGNEAGLTGAALAAELLMKKRF